MLQYAKALVAALVAGLGALGTALLDDQVVAVEWVGVASATLVALGAVWGTPNRKPDEIERLVAREQRTHPGPDVDGDAALARIRPGLTAEWVCPRHGVHFGATACCGDALTRAEAEAAPRLPAPGQHRRGPDR